MSLSTFPRRKASGSRSRAASLDEPTSVEHLSFTPHILDEDETSAQNAWTAVDLDPDMWSPAIGIAPLAAKCRGPVMPSCMLDSSQLAILTGSGLSRFEPRDDYSESERGMALRRDQSTISEWPDSYHMLGEPLSYTMSDPANGNAPRPVQIQTQYEDDDGNRSDMGSVVSVMSSTAPQSRVSSVSSFSMSIDRTSNMATPNCKVTAPGQMPGYTHRSDTSSHTVSTGLSSGPFPSSHKKQPPLADVIADEQAILKASVPTQIGGRHGRYMVVLVRTIVSQAFGLEFVAAETRDKRLSGIFVSDDNPHLGMSRWDRLLSINGAEPMSVQDCQAMLKQQLLIALVLQSKSKQSTEPLPKPDMQSLPLQDQRLLTIKKEMLQNNASDFKLMIARRSPKVIVDLPFDAAPSKSKEQGLLFATRDMPHLEILAGDQLLSLNGIRSWGQKALRRIMDTSCTIELRLRRDVARGKPGPSEQLGIYEDPNCECFRDKTAVSEVCARNYICCAPDLQEDRHELVQSMSFLHQSDEVSARARPGRR